jgi:hypothetical protein
MMSNNRLSQFLVLLQRVIVMTQSQHCKEKLVFGAMCEVCRLSRCYREVFGFLQSVDKTKKRLDTDTQPGVLAPVDALQP